MFGCFRLFLGLLNVCELVVRKLPFIKCFKIDVFSASHGALFQTQMLEYAAFLPKQSPTSQLSENWTKKHNLWPGVWPTMRHLDAIPGEDFSTKSNHKMMLIAVNKWLCKVEMETRFGVRLTSAMLDNGNMKNMLCFATHSMDKDMCLYKRPNIVDETLGST